MLSKLKLVSTLIAMFFASSVAWGQNNISLNGDTSGSVQFKATGGGNLSVLLGACNVGLGSHCIDGPASGNGIFGGGSPPLSGFYLISGASTLTLTNTSPTTWTVSGGTFAFFFTSGADNSGTNFLSGTLDLIDLGQSGGSGTFNTNFVANLTGLSGTLAGLFTSSGGIANLALKLSTSTLLSSLATNSTASGTLDHGAITQTPEPGSMMLLGSGLLVLGAFFRRKLRPLDT